MHHCDWCRVDVLAAQYNLGVMYVAGEDVPEDYVQAYKWFNLAVAQGSEGAKKRVIFYAH